MTVIAMTTALIPANRHPPDERSEKEKRKICIISSSTNTHIAVRCCVLKELNKKDRKTKITNSIEKERKRNDFSCTRPTLDGSRSSCNQVLRIFLNWFAKLCVCARRRRRLLTLVCYDVIVTDGGGPARTK